MCIVSYVHTCIYEVYIYSMVYYTSVDYIMVLYGVYMVYTCILYKLSSV